jgi:protein TonB
MRKRRFLHLPILLALACAGGDGPEVRTTTVENADWMLRQESRKQARVAEKNLECCARIAAGGDECKIRRLPPVYPKDALRKRMNGKVLVEYSIGEDGRVHDARVVKSAPPGVFEEAALRNVNAWQFCPGDPQTGRQAMLPFSTNRP